VKADMPVADEPTAEITADGSAEHRPIASSTVVRAEDRT
jgi:hypothetical protein